MTETERGRAAVVTGAASGIGRAVLERFVGDERYDRVAGLDVDDAVLDLADEEAGIEAYVVDVSDHDAVHAVVETVEERADVDALVNNAGVSRYEWIGDLTPEEWNRVLAVNLTGQYNLAHAVCPGMYERERGYVVNVSSGAGQRGSLSGGVHYSASKAGVFGLTKGLARQLAPHVRVNCVVPGLIATPLATDSGLWTAEDLAAFEDDLPLGRIGRSDEVARVVHFLCGDGANYMTGSVVNVDGGAALA